MDRAVATPREDTDTGLACLLILARVFGVGADGEQLRHEFGTPGEKFRGRELLRAARTLDLKARRVRSRWARLSGLPLPAIALQRGGRFIVLARADADTVLVQDPTAPRPAVLSLIRRGLGKPALEPDVRNQSEAARFPGVHHPPLTGKRAEGNIRGAEPEPSGGTAFSAGCPCSCAAGVSPG